MRITPRTEQDVAPKPIIKKGIYKFRIEAAADKVSAAGNDMIVLTVQVQNEAGKAIAQITDYLTEKNAAKLRHAAAACCAIARYDTGELSAADFIGKRGNCRVIVTKDHSGKFGDKNEIADYVTLPFLATAQASGEPSAGAA